MSELDFWFWVPAQCLDQQGGGRDTVEGIQCLTPEGYDTHQLRHLGQLTVPLGALSMKYLVHGGS